MTRCILLELLHTLRPAWRLGLLLALLLGSLSAARAQEVGFRVGDVLGNTVAVDARFNNVHADVSFGNAVGIEVLWDVLYEPLGKGAFDWYIGVGPSALLDDPFLLGLSAEAGIDLHIARTPLALGLDYRPTLWLLDEVDLRGGSFGLNVRFVFGGE